MSDNVVTVRKRRGKVRGRLTRIEREIVDLERKDELNDQDQCKVDRLITQIKDNDSEFKQRHLEVLNFVTEEDDDTLQREENVFDEHVNRVTELIERLEPIKASGRALLSSSTPSTVPDHSGNLEKHLKFIDHQRETIATSMPSPPAGTESHPKLFLQKCQKDIVVLTAQLTGIMGDILALPGEDTTLLTNATVIQGALSELDFEAG